MKIKNQILITGNIKVAADEAEQRRLSKVTAIDA
jgi:hypothetical protein